MRTAATVVVLLASAGAVWADDDFPPQARGPQAPKQGGRVWMEIEIFRGQLEADSASGTNTPEHTTDGFNDDIDTFLQQGIAWVAGGYELDLGLTIYGKLGYAFPTVIQDIDASSIIAGASDERRSAGLDPFFAYGIGVSFRREMPGGLILLGRAEWTAGTADVDNTDYHDLGDTDGDYEYRRLEVKGAVGFQTELAAPYAGLRYNLLRVDLDLEEPGVAPDNFNVEYELKTPIGVFAGVTGRVADRTIWHAEIGFVDALTVEVGVGLAF